MGLLGLALPKALAQVWTAPPHVGKSGPGRGIGYGGSHCHCSFLLPGQICLFPVIPHPAPTASPHRTYQLWHKLVYLWWKQASTGFPPAPWASAFPQCDFQHACNSASACPAGAGPVRTGLLSTAGLSHILPAATFLFSIDLCREVAWEGILAT